MVSRPGRERALWARQGCAGISCIQKRKERLWLENVFFNVLAMPYILLIIYFIYFIYLVIFKYSFLK